jgi:hypothetical protein
VGLRYCVGYITESNPRERRFHMKKRAAQSKPSSKKRKVSRPKAEREDQIAGTLANLNQIRPTNQKTANILAMLKAWLRDDSGYDEATWPKLKKALVRTANDYRKRMA